MTDSVSAPTGEPQPPTDAAWVLENHLGGADAPRYRDYQFELIAPHCGRSVLEVGAGLGEFAAQFSSLEGQVLTDVEPHCLSELRRRFAGAPHVEVAEWRLPGPAPIAEPVETVLAINMLEHIDDHVGALRDFASALVPGGSIVLWVPGYPALYGDFDRKVGHFRRYTPATLTAAGHAAGLEVQVARPVNLLGAVAWWAAVRMGRAGQTDPRMIRVYDRVLIPATRAIEARVRPRFGQTILGVLRKPRT